jgi:hypothetical protein
VILWRLRITQASLEVAAAKALSLDDRTKKFSA